MFPEKLDSREDCLSDIAPSPDFYSPILMELSEKAVWPVAVTRKEAKSNGRMSLADRCVSR